MTTKNIVIGIAAVAAALFLIKKSKKPDTTIPPDVSTPPAGLPTETQSNFIPRGGMWEGKRSRSAVANARIGLAGKKNMGSTPGNRAVIYGCYDGTTSKTAAGCKDHGGAEWIKGQ